MEIKNAAGKESQARELGRELPPGFQDIPERGKQSRLRVTAPSTRRVDELP